VNESFKIELNEESGPFLFSKTLAGSPDLFLQPFFGTLLLHTGRKQIEGVKVGVEEGFSVLSNALSLDM